MAKAPRPPLAEMIAKTPAAQSRSEAMAHIERRRMAIHVDAKNGQPTSKADPESFFENIYPDPPTLEDARKLRPPKPRVVRKKADVDESNREKPKSQRSTTTKFSIVKSDDDPAA